MKSDDIGRIGVEPLNTEEIASARVWLDDVAREQPPGNKVTVTAVSTAERLLATVYARDELVDKLRQESRLWRALAYARRSIILAEKRGDETKRLAGAIAAKSAKDALLAAGHDPYEICDDA